MIKLKVGDKELTLKWNSSLRFKDFQTGNEIKDEATARQLFQLAFEAHGQEVFSKIEWKNVTKVTEKAVYKKGQFRKNVTIAADGGLIKVNDLHLIDVWMEKKNEENGKAMEKAMNWKLTQESLTAEKRQAESIGTEK